MLILQILLTSIKDIRLAYPLFRLHFHSSSFIILSSLLKQGTKSTMSTKSFFPANTNDNPKTFSPNQTLPDCPTLSQSTKGVNMKNKENPKNWKRKRERSQTLGEESDCSLHEASPAAHRARKMLKLDSSSLPKGK